MKFLFVLAALVGSASAQCAGLPAASAGYTATVAPTNNGTPDTYAVGAVFEVVIGSTCAPGYWGSSDGGVDTTATCTAGAPDAWVWMAGIPTGCTACTTTGFCGMGTFFDASKCQGNGATDDSCSACKTSCPSGQYLSGTCDGSGTSDSITCAACTATGSCFMGTFFDASKCKGTGTTDDSCSAWATCLTGEYEFSPPSDTVNRVCDACPDGEFSATTNALFCIAWTTCVPGEYVSTMPSDTEDRVCTACPPGEFSATTNAASCAAWTTCVPGEYVDISTMPSDTVDRVCTACPPGEFSATTNAASCAVWYVCGTAEMETDTPSATTNRVCGWKTCADAGEDLRVRGVNGNADPDADPAAITVDAIVPQVSCLCGANQEGLLGVVPGTKTLVQTCADSEAGAVEHEMTVTFTVDFSFPEYSNSATKAEVDATAAAALWAASGLEAVHVKFQNAAENADNDQHTDVNFKLIFASESWALDTTGAIDLIPLASLSPLTKFLSVSYTTPSEYVLDGAAHSGVGVLAAAVVATALLL